MKTIRYPSSQAGDRVGAWFKPDTDYVEVVKPEPGHIHDWAAKAGAYLHAEGVRLSSHRIAAVVAYFAEPLVKLLREARREHHHCDDSWYCCRACRSADHTLVEGEHLGTNDQHIGDGSCTCGADAWNKRIDEVLHGEEG